MTYRILFMKMTRAAWSRAVLTFSYSSHIYLSRNEKENTLLFSDIVVKSDFKTLIYYTNNEEALLLLFRGSTIVLFSANVLS